jgi:hypothetical protein
MIKKFATGLAAGAAVLAAAGASNAALQPIANFGGGGVGTTDVVFVSDGVGGGTLTISLTRDISNAAGTNISDATLSMTTTMVANSAVSGGGFTAAQFNPGSFTITKSGQTLLSGDFGILGLASFAPGTFSLQAVVSNYASTGVGAGNFVNVFKAVHNCIDLLPGNLSFSASAINPALSVYATGMGNGLESFTSQLSGNFDADCVPNTAVPEPSEWAAMGLGVLGVGGLMVRARRRTAKA